MISARLCGRSTGEKAVFIANPESIKLRVGSTGVSLFGNASGCVPKAAQNLASDQVKKRHMPWAHLRRDAENYTCKQCAVIIMTCNQINKKKEFWPLEVLNPGLLLYKLCRENPLRKLNTLLMMGLSFRKLLSTEVSGLTRKVSKVWDLLSVSTSKRNHYHYYQCHKSIERWLSWCSDND